MHGLSGEDPNKAREIAIIDAEIKQLQGWMKAVEDGLPSKDDAKAPEEYTKEERAVWAKVFISARDVHQIRQGYVDRINQRRQVKRKLLGLMISSEPDDEDDDMDGLPAKNVEAIYQNLNPEMGDDEATQDDASGEAETEETAVG